MDLVERAKQWLRDWEENEGPVISSPSEMCDEAAEIIEKLLTDRKLREG